MAEFNHVWQSVTTTGRVCSRVFCAMIVIVCRGCARNPQDMTVKLLQWSAQWAC